MATSAYITFSILMVVSIICAVVLTYYICRLAKSVKELSDNANSIALSVQKEIEPTLKELKEAAVSINSIANSADEKFKDAKSGISAILGATSLLGGKLKSFSSGILKGISFGLGLFKK